MADETIAGSDARGSSSEFLNDIGTPTLRQKQNSIAVVGADAFVDGAAGDCPTSSTMMECPIKDNSSPAPNSDTECPASPGNSEDDSKASSEDDDPAADAAEPKVEAEEVKEGREEEKEEEKEGDGKPEKESGSGAEQEVILIQDTSFTVKILAPGVVEPFDLQVSSMELVQEIHQVLMDREDTCHRTCFSLHIDGRPGPLDAFSELKTIPELCDGATLHVVEEPYSIREARIHVRHIRDLLKSVDMTDAYMGHDGASLSILNHITGGDVTMTLPDMAKRRSRIPDAIDCTPPEMIMPGAKPPPLTFLHPLSPKESKGPVCLKAMALSGWNPPPGNRRLQGDLIYLYVVTMEDKKFHVTSCTKGFYLNNCTDDSFDPRPTESEVFHSLIELLNQISPHFRKNFAALTKRRVNKHPFERVATPYQVYTWLSPSLEHSVDPIRAEDAFSSKLGYEEHLPAQTRDWNEEIQTTRELARKSLPDRLVRERAMFKVHSDFVMAATKGAISVVDGNVMAINPGEDPKMQMFIWNNIFFSLGFDVKDHYKEFGGDAAAFSAPANDLQGVKAYSGIDVEGLYTLGTVVLDYRGFRITAQSIIPGILDREQEQSVVYGSIDFGKTVVVDPKYQDLLRKTAEALKIRPHRVLDEKDSPVELFSSIECKGIVGNDGRHYILDLLRTFPPDVNYLRAEGGGEVGAVARELGFPVQHKHRLVCLRQELIDTFIEARYVQFVKHAALQFQQLRFQQHFIDRKLATIKDVAPKAEASAAGAGEAKGPTDKASGVEAANLNAETTMSETLSPEEGKRRCHVEAIEAALKSTRGDSEEREIKEAKKIVETLIPESTKHRREASDPEDSPASASNEAKKPDDPADSADPAGAESFEKVSKEIVKRSAQAVSSLADDEFDIRFNPDIFQAGVRHPQTPEDLEVVEKEKRLVVEAADFLLAYQIPALIRDSMDHTSSPIDGITLTEAMHQRGINIRYLGKLAQRLAKVPELDYFLTIVLTEILVRSAKHVFQAYLQSVPQDSMAAAIAHFLNCFFGVAGDGDPSSVFPSPDVSPSAPSSIGNNANHAANASANAANGNAASMNFNDNRKAAKRKKGKNRKSTNSTTTASSSMKRSTESDEWRSTTGADLWTKIRADAEAHFLWKFAEDESMESFCSSVEASRVAILRNFCLKVGIQLQLRDYALEEETSSPPSRDSGVPSPVPSPTAGGGSGAKRSPTGGARSAAFQPEDVMGMYPIVKHINPKATDAYHFFNSGQSKVQQGLLKEGYELITEALNLLNNVYGAMHPEIAACLRLLARLNYIMGDHGEALCYQQKACLMTERVLGLDHPHTVTEYANLGLYCFANGHVTSALKLFYRARYLALLCHGERHPEVALFDSNIGLILHAVGEFDLALKFLENALSLNRHYFGETSLKTALSCHFVARVQSCRGDFRSALSSEKETYAIYRSQLGEEHDKTRESSECLKHLTKQAVIFQKKMNEIYKGEKMAALPPIQVAPPSLSSVLELLNVINGILFVHVSQKELESLRNEVRKQQQQRSYGGSAPGAPALSPAVASTVTPSAAATSAKDAGSTSSEADSKDRRSSDEMDEGLGSGDEIIEQPQTPVAEPQNELREMSSEDLD